MKRFLSNQKIKEDILNFDACNISQKIKLQVQNLLKYKSKSFDAEHIKRVSVAAAPLGMSITILLSDVINTIYFVLHPFIFLIIYTFFNVLPFTSLMFLDHNLAAWVKANFEHALVLERVKPLKTELTEAEKEISYA